jgi:hypothetical protein
MNGLAPLPSPVPPPGPVHVSGLQIEKTYNGYAGTVHDVRFERYTTYVAETLPELLELCSAKLITLEK